MKKILVLATAMLMSSMSYADHITVQCFFIGNDGADWEAVANTSHAINVYAANCEAQGGIAWVDVISDDDDPKISQF